MLTKTDPSKVKWAELSLLEIAEGNAMDTFFTLKIFKKLYEFLEANPKLMIIYSTLLSPLNNVFIEPEFNGLNVSTKRLKQVGAELKTKVLEAEDQVYLLPKVKKTLKISSNSNLVDLFYEDSEGFQLYPPKYTKSGKEPSTDRETLETLELLIEEELIKRAKDEKEKG